MVLRAPTKDENVPARASRSDSDLHGRILVAREYRRMLPTHND